MWGLMAFPSSSTAAGAVPAFRAASRSFCLRNSSRDNFPTPASQIRLTKFTTNQFYVPVPEAMVARVKDRLTKAGGAIVLKSHHVLWPKRVFVAILHHCLLLDDHTHRSSTCGRTGCRYDPLAGSSKAITPPSPTHRCG